MIIIFKYILLGIPNVNKVKILLTIINSSKLWKYITKCLTQYKIRDFIVVVTLNIKQRLKSLLIGF